jgi:RHS repeat-associated protein
MQILSRAFLGEKIKRQDVLTNRTLNGGGGFYTVDDRNQLVTEPSFSDVYDANGNLTTRSGGGSLYSFGYDNENRLITATWYNNSKSEFKYDGLSRLRTRDDYIWMGSGWYPNGTVRYIYDGMNVVQERSSANTPTAAYTRGPDLSGTLQGAGGIGGMLARSHGYSGGSWSTHNFYHADGTGNITYLVNSVQGLAAKYKYDPYGRTISSTGPLSAANLYRFSSKEINLNSGMYYYGYRFYHPMLQRWMNRDPIGEAGFRAQFRVLSKPVRMHLTAYSFVSNDPLSACDPFGLTDYRGIDEIVNGSTSLEDCLDGCDNLRQKDLQRLVGPAAAARTTGTLIGGMVVVVGGLLLVPPPSRIIGCVVIVGGGLYCGYEWCHNTNKEEKGEAETKDRFGRCCASCGERWDDIDTAIQHFQQIYPNW